jgi:mxaA protein
MKTIISIMLLFLATTSSATSSFFELNVKNPQKQIGYVVGDTFTRIVELDVNAPYKLSTASIPVKGTSQKGIELGEVKVTEKKSSRLTHYQIKLQYQIFTSGSEVKKLELAKHLLKITDRNKLVAVAIPAWQFRVSPLAVAGEVYIEQDMSPYRGPMLVSGWYAKSLLGVCLGMVLAALFGLIYINADYAWFPGMGGPFAMSYREISSLVTSDYSENIENIQKATTSIHHAFNQTYGENLFATDIESFLYKYSKFASIKLEIIYFFQQSNNVLFGVTSNSLDKSSIATLIKFCEQCRNCERGVA